MQNHQQKKKKKNWYEKDFVLILSPTFIEDVRLSVISDPSQSIGAPEKCTKKMAILSEKEVAEDDYEPLLQAAIKGDWESAELFFNRDPASKTAKITKRSETVLHIATLNAQDQFVENLVKLLPPEALEDVDCDGRTALHNAVLCGSITMVKALVSINHRLTQLDDNEARVPLEISAWEGYMHKDIAWFLAKKTTDDEPSQPFSGPYAFLIIYGLTVAGHHDITLHLVRQYRQLMTLEDLSILDELAKVNSNFLSGTRLSIMEALVYKCIPVDLNFEPTNDNSDPEFQWFSRSLWNAAKIIVPITKRIYKVKLRHVAALELAKKVCNEISCMNDTVRTEYVGEKDQLARTISEGFPELVKLLILSFQKGIWLSPDYNSLRTTAVENRRESILRLFLKGTLINRLSLVPAPTSKESKRMMMAVARYNPNLNDVTKISGAAFEMQRELQWFKVIEMCVMPYARADKNKGKTYWEIFAEEHDKLRESGEKLMKDTAESCMLVSTLIATVLFAAAFTVPGGNDNSTGVPLLLAKDSLLVFAISDAFGLFSSVTAIMSFLAILTSRYEWEDFLESLPKKIIVGLSFLFISLVFMMLAFAATLIIVLEKRLDWVLIPITLLASFPMALFILLQLPLLFQMLKSTYGANSFRPMGTRK